VFLKLFGMNEANPDAWAAGWWEKVSPHPPGLSRSSLEFPNNCDPLQLPYKGRTAIRFSLRHLGISLDAGQPCLKSPGFNPSALTAAHVQLVLVMYTPSFRPFVSEIVSRWSAGRPAASRLCKQKDRRIDRRSFR
jgi:hypothetical protein